MKNLAKCKIATQKMVAATYQKELLAAKAAGSKDAILPSTGKTTLADAVSSITAAFNSLLVSSYQTLFSFTDFTLGQVERHIEDLEATREEYERQRAMHVANLNGFPTLTGVLLRFFVFIVAAFLVSFTDAIILSNAFMVFTPTLLTSILLAVGVCISLILLPAFSCILAQRAQTVKARRWIEWGSLGFAVVIFTLLIYARYSFDVKTGNEQSGLAYGFYFCLNLLSYFILHLLSKLLLLPLLNDLKPAWEAYLEKRKVKALTKKISRIKKMIEAKERESSQLSNAEREAVLQEEQIARLYSQVLSAYRQAYRLSAKGELPDWLNDKDPELDFILKGKQPLTITPVAQDIFNITRTPIGFKYGAALLLGLYSCSIDEPKPTRFTGIVYDQTAYDSPNIDTDNIIKIAGLHDDPDRGIQVYITTVSAKQFTPVHRLSLEALPPLASNSTKRPAAVAAFARSIDSVLAGIPPAPKELKDSSLIFHKIGLLVKEFVACKTCSDGVLYIRSDMLEHNAVFSAYSDITYLRHHRKQAVDTLRKTYSIPEITKPLNIIIAHDPALKDEGKFSLMLELLQDYFGRSSLVTIAP